MPGERRRARWPVMVALGASLAAVGGMWWVWQDNLKVPGSTFVADPPISSHASGIIAQAQAAWDAGEHARAEQMLRAAAEAWPGSQPVQVALARRLMAGGRPAEAWPHYLQALRLGPDSPALHFEAAQAATAAGLDREALRHLTHAAAGDAFNAEYALHLGLAQRRAGQHGAARASFLRVVHLDARCGPAWGALAELALAENNLPMALQYGARARAIEPDTLRWRLIEARALKRSGEPARALALLEDLSHGEMLEPTVARLRAECLGMLGQQAEAGMVLADAADLHRDATMLVEAALAFERAGARARALELACRAQALGAPGAAALAARLAR